MGSETPSSTTTTTTGGHSDNSPLFHVKDAPGAGRGVFAMRDLPRGTTVHVATDLAAHVLLREHRGEVCWQCFAYDRGNKLPVRDARRGFAFCSRECETRLISSDYDDVCLEAWAAVEKLIKSRTTKRAVDARDQEDPMITNGSHDDDDSRPTPSHIDQAWTLAQQAAARILSARAGGATTTTRDQRKALQQALEGTPSPDVLAFHTHAVLTRYRAPAAWDAVLTLEADARPYASARELRDHVAAYLQLAAALPAALPRRGLVTPETFRAAKAHEVHNSFGIRSLGDEGAEFFGYGVWPSASYFNHSCDPNVYRRRVGRAWVFEARADVPAGQELHISYLGGEEVNLDVADRRARLKRTWGFDCVCQRCASG